MSQASESPKRLLHAQRESANDWITAASWLGLLLTAFGVIGVANVWLLMDEMSAEIAVSSLLSHVLMGAAAWRLGKTRSPYAAGALLFLWLANALYSLYQHPDAVRILFRAAIGAVYCGGLVAALRYARLTTAIDSHASVDNAAA